MVDVRASDAGLLAVEGVRLRSIGTEPIDMMVRTGERLGLLGDSDSGRRQLLRTMARLEEPATGRIRWNGVDVTRRPRWLMPRDLREGVILIWENPYVLFEQNRLVRHIVQSGTSLVEAGLTPVALDLQVQSLSGFARVRLALAYAARRRPRVMLVDDIFHYLAPAVWQEVIRTLERILPVETALVVASRYPAVLESMARVMAMSGGDIVDGGSASEVLARV
jgi:ABC-type branched-subunit amino acid transport system ATPase component